jgi:predicted RNA-binding protein YlxR (DUF448 family)
VCTCVYRNECAYMYVTVSVQLFAKKRGVYVERNYISNQKQNDKSIFEKLFSIYSKLNSESHIRILTSSSNL